MYNIRKYKRQSLSFFEKAKQGGIAEASYYLGNLYHLNKQYNDAINSFIDYKKIFTKKKYTDSEVDVNSKMYYRKRIS